MFAAHGLKTELPFAVLSGHFLALISWKVMLERECAVSDAPTKAETRTWVESVVDDFIKAFLRPA